MQFSLAEPSTYYAVKKLRRETQVQEHSNAHLPSGFTSKRQTAVQFQQSLLAHSFNSIDCGLKGDCARTAFLAMGGMGREKRQSPEGGITEAHRILFIMSQLTQSNYSSIALHSR